ncbi:MAG: hypothetical protein IIA68_07860 [Proteobacteria bacterium]|nr:hypothetical protein [Pseudomonadota bacterium]
MFVWIKRIFLPAAALGMLAMPTAVLADGSHKGAQVWPIELGTTGSTEALLDIDGIEYCFAGTLGGLVEDDAYILSNNHVLAQTNAMAAGEPIIQPALFDDGDVCSGVVEPVAVANLSDFVPIVFCEPVGRFMMKCANNTVDAAIAGVVGGAVNVDGVILDIGEPAETSASATLGTLVQKSGRTSGHTTGTVAAVDVDVLVCYFDPCNDPSDVARFVNQVRVDGAFSAPGDSGSLILECVDDGAGGCAPLPVAVGLLFAGGASTTFFNPIDAVFSELNVAMAGCGEPCFTQTTDDGSTTKNGKGGGNNGKKKSFGAGLDFASEVRAQHTDELLERRGVMGTGLSVDENGDPVIEVYVKSATAEAGRPIPSDLDGIAVRVIVTGQIRAF